jgi:anti-sigma regulatory factor (Ser/Thr protein kinase)
MLAEAAVAATCSINATPDGICALDGWIERIGASWRLPGDVVFRARVCVAEVAANLMEHGCSNPGGEPMSVVMRADACTLSLELRDSGRAFDPTAPTDTSASAAGMGGRGLRLLHAYAAAMRYRREVGRNILTLRVTPASPAAGAGSP